MKFNAAGTCTIDANQAGNGNYNAAAQVQQKVTVTSAKQSQTIKFTSTPPTTPTIGGTYTVTATATSGLPVSFSIDSSSTSGACSISGSVITFTGAGTCKIDANQAGNSTYNPAPQVQQSLTVTVTASGICTLTLTYVEGSAAFKSLPSWEQSAIEQIANQGCEELMEITPHLSPSQIAQLVAEYKQVVAALQQYGFLSAAQATTLDNAATTLL